MAREIVFDTETTGFGVDEHRIIEIGAVEIINRLPTGRVFHRYLNPEREIDFGAQKVHGITNERVANEPKFAEVLNDLLDFFGDDCPLVAHNAAFDKEFVNMELGRCGHPGFLPERFVDTLEIAKKKLPGQRHNLDALCRHFNVDNSGRTFHGALLDAQLLADVYVELLGGLQGALVLETETGILASTATGTTRIHSNTTVISATGAEQERHAAFLAKMVPGHPWPF